MKVHHLMVLEKTQMAHQWRKGELSVLEPGTYVSWLADFVERLGEAQVLHRITGDAPDGKELAPRWGVAKNVVREHLREELERRGTRQGVAVRRLSADDRAADDAWLRRDAAAGSSRGACRARRCRGGLPPRRAP